MITKWLLRVETAPDIDTTVSFLPNKQVELVFYYSEDVILHADVTPHLVHMNNEGEITEDFELISIKILVIDDVTNGYCQCVLSYEEIVCKN